MSEFGDYVSPQEYWSVRTAYEAGVRERMAGWDGVSVTDSPVPGDANYGPQEPQWDEAYYDPDDTYGDMVEPDPDEWHESRLERLADMYDGWPSD